MKDLFDSGHLQHKDERPDMEKIWIVTWPNEELEFTTLISKMCDSTNIKLAHILQYKSWLKTQAKPELLLIQ